MPPNVRKWNDVETAIAMAAIVTTIGFWNLFATPAKTTTTQAPEPATLPPTEPSVASQEPVSMPQVKIMFTQAASQTTTVQQAQQVLPQLKKKKHNNNNSGGGGGGGPSVTQTRSS